MDCAIDGIHVCVMTLQEALISCYHCHSCVVIRNHHTVCYRYGLTCLQRILQVLTVLAVGLHHHHHVGIQTCLLSVQARIKIRVVCARAYHALFMYNMLIRPTDQELLNFGKPDFTILNAGAFPVNRYTSYMSSSTSVDVSLK